VDLVIARRPKADVAISYPSKVEGVPVPKRLTMTPTVSIVTRYYLVEVFMPASLLREL